MFKIGDRVVINNPVRGSHGRRGVIHSKYQQLDSKGFNVVLDRLPNDSYTVNIPYSPEDLILDKNYTIAKILEEL